MNKYNDIVIITGVSASGKDHLLSRALETTQDARTPITCFAFGAEMHKLMNGECKTRDSLRDLPAIQARKLALEVIKRVREAQGTRILNTHVAHRQGDLIVTDPITDLEIAARDYIFVAADPEEITKRRQQDMTRTRADESSEMISIHQAVALATVAAISKVLGSRLTILDNRPDNLEENITSMRSIITDR